MSTTFDSSGLDPATTVAVTGLGAVSPWGWTVHDFWRGLLAGEPGISEADQFDVRGQRTSLASEVRDDDRRRDDLVELWRSAAARRWSRADRFAVAASVEAWHHAELDTSNNDGEVGIFFGGSTAAMAEGEEFFEQLLRQRRPRPTIRYLASHQINGPGDAVARHLGVCGRVETLSSACASGGLALGSALDALRRGEVDIALAGGADSLCKLTYAGFNSLRAVDAELCAPFHAERSGLNLGEGAGVLILETVARALSRGRTPLALLLGHGASCDAHHMTAPHPEGEGASRAIAAALRDADVGPAEILFINAHGTGTQLNDKAEGAAFARILEQRVSHVPVTSTKGLVGHYLGSSGAIEAVASVLGLHHGLVHPTPGRGEVDPEIPVDLVRRDPRRLDTSGPGLGCAVSTSFAFGGSNAAVVFARWPRAS
ncbi:MAG: beta-ketoacyl-[acyl-carrier-protein] synthase family protein [Thermoanaerobaculia bacterium]|nr:beta-ketoacyl-[acyl-carrier-protein] synthase family protein [Thermoanaerobaculia bacterium]